MQEVTGERRQGGGYRAAGGHSERGGQGGGLREVLHVQDEGGMVIRRWLLVPEHGMARNTT